MIRRTIFSSPLKACELEAFPTALLLEWLDSLLPCITAVFNNSLVSGVFPSVYKSALVKPLLKKMSLDPDDLKNYRPVSNLSFLSKVLERIVLSQLNEHLNHNNLLSPLQSDYRPNKTEAMIILSNRMSVHSPLPSVIHIGDADVPFVSSVKNLGVTLDSNLSMSQHISNTCKAAYIQIRHISSIRHLLTTQATQTLVCSLVLSRLDYCNSLLSGCPQYLLDKLQKVQNAVARLVCKAKKSDHIHPILATLHWLPVTHRIQYKISTICFNSISGTAPQYLSDLLQPYTPARQLRSASDTRTFVTPRVNTKTFGERSFSYAGPSVWNNLP